MGGIKKEARAANFNIDNDRIPGLYEELVAHLEALFPPRCMHATENGNAHQRYAGRVELVQLLRYHLTEQTEAHLDAVLGDDA